MLHKILFFIISISIPFGQLNQKDTWHFEKEKNGIKLYTKDHPASGIKSFKAETIYDAKPTQILAALMDVQSLPLYYDMTKDVVEFEQINEKSAEYTIIFDFPFPVKDRYCRVQSNIILRSDGSFRIVSKKIKSKSDHAPLLEVGMLDVTWELHAHNGDKTQAIHQGHMDPSGSIPSWLANMTVIESPYNSLLALKTFSTSYADTEIPWLK